MPCPLMLRAQCCAGRDRRAHLLAQQRQPDGGHSHLPHCPLPAFDLGEQGPLHVCSTGLSGLATLSHVLPPVHSQTDCKEGLKKPVFVWSKLSAGVQAFTRRQVLKQGGAEGQERHHPVQTGNDVVTLLTSLA